jgi:hypothetical protein
VTISPESERLLRAQAPLEDATLDAVVERVLVAYCAPPAVVPAGTVTGHACVKMHHRYGHGVTLADQVAAVGAPPAAPKGGA